MTAFGIGPWTDVITGARTMPSVFTFPILPYLNKMNFLERLFNTVITDIYWFGMQYSTIPEQQKLAEKLYGQPLPPLLEIASNISLILVNNHYAINGPQAQLPGIIEVGCMQCSEPKPLPKDLAEFLDGSEQGAIFFSLGSNIKKGRPKR
ncbi:hypothetical protein J437_LFUL019292 [Ladona fulva]|uniref:Uncharacterized protein n=1 Tax=Ladona fulva TaxID=123851 RepID=A0A8K0KR45_LADFU|nr:hypothetical protein J437_LFUL019292 [Ladona fulva]